MTHERHVKHSEWFKTHPWTGSDGRNTCCHTDRSSLYGRRRRGADRMVQTMEVLRITHNTVHYCSLQCRITHSFTY